MFTWEFSENCGTGYLENSYEQQPLKHVVFSKTYKIDIHGNKA